MKYDPTNVTRNVAQNTRPSFRFSGEGLGTRLQRKKAWKEVGKGVEEPGMRLGVTLFPCSKSGGIEY